MAAADDFEEVLKQYHLALDEIMKGPKVLKESTPVERM
jgi:hypothetical protein